MPKYGRWKMLCHLRPCCQPSGGEDPMGNRITRNQLPRVQQKVLTSDALRNAAVRLASQQHLLGRV